MKCVFPLSLITILCIAGSVHAVSAFKKKEKPKQEQQQEIKIAVRTVDEIVKETTDKANLAKFGLAAMLKAFQEQAKNSANKDKAVFEQDAKVGEELRSKGVKKLDEARPYVEKLSSPTKTALLAAIKQYPLFKQKAVAEEFFKS